MRPKATKRPKIITTLSTPEFTTRFDAEVRRNQHVAAALELLEGKSCQRSFILLFIEAYCGGAVSRYVVGARGLASRLKALARRLSKITAEIREANGLAASQLARHGSSPFELPAIIEQYVSALNGAAAEIGEASVRKQPGKVLIALADYVESTTGKKHYEELATLIQAGYAAHLQEETFTAEQVRKIISRARAEEKEYQSTHPVPAETH